MAQKIINLTLQVVIQEIESVFDNYFHPYRQVFVIPELLKVNCLRTKPSAVAIQ